VIKVLVVASEPISAPALRAALDGGDGPDLEDAEIKVVAPALHASALQFWISDADEAIASAEAIWRTSVAKLGAAGVDAEGDVGESEPVQAIEDALTDFDADRILVFTHPEPAQRYREDVDRGELERRFNRPVEHVPTSGSS
jgi:hypothetical protein